jgi:hypothetical protein
MATKKVTAADTTADPRLQEMSAAEMRMINEANEDRMAKKQREASERLPVLGGKRMGSGGMVSSASKRADGCAIRGKTRGKMV